MVNRNFLMWFALYAICVGMLILAIVIIQANLKYHKELKELEKELDQREEELNKREIRLNKLEARKHGKDIQILHKS